MYSSRSDAHLKNEKRDAEPHDSSAEREAHEHAPERQELGTVPALRCGESCETGQPSPVLVTCGSGHDRHREERQREDEIEDSRGWMTTRPAELFGIDAGPPRDEDVARAQRDPGED